VHAATLIVLAVAGAVAPVELRPRPLDKIILNNGTSVTGTLISERDSPTIRIRMAVGERALPREQVAKILPRQTIADAHDECAAGLDAGDAQGWHALALAAVGHNLPDRAVSDLATAIAAQPTYAPAHALLVRLLLRQRKIAEAREAARRGLTQAGRSAELFVASGEVLAALGEDPRGEYMRALAVGPSVEACIGLARAETVRGRYAAAEKALDDAGRISPGDRLVDVARADFLLARGRLAEAQLVYARAVAAEKVVLGGGGDSGARIGLAAVHYMQGQLDQADEALLRADLTDPGVSFLQALVKSARAGDAAVIRRLFNAAASGGIARAYLGLGTQLYHDLGEDFVAALAEFRKATTADPSDPYALYLSAWCEFRLGRLDEALRDYTRVAELAPTCAEAHAAAAAVAYASGSYAQAVRLYRHGLDACPGDARLLAGLGIAQLAGGDMDAARTSLDGALAAGSRGPDVYAGLGYLLHALDSDGEAVRYFTAALSAAEATRGASAAGVYAREAMSAILASQDRRVSTYLFEVNGPPPGPFRAACPFSVDARVEGGRLVFTGTQTGEDGGRTEVSVPADGGALRSFSAELGVPPGSSVTCGIFVRSQSGGVELAHVPGFGAAVRYKDGRDAQWTSWQAVGDWPGDGFARLTVAVSPIRGGKAQVDVRASAPRFGPGQAAPATGAQLAEALWRERAFTMGFFTSARTGVEVRVTVDAAVVVELSGR